MDCPSRLDWYDTPELNQLPLAVRLWVWWCAVGPKRGSGGTLGGNRLFSLLHRYLRVIPANRDNLHPVKMSRWDRDLVVDLCDFESYQHTLPLASRGNDEMALQDSVLGPESVFIDVGANQGLFSVHAATLIGRGGRILSIEPNARLASALRRTKLLNDFDQMEVVESAVGDTSGVQDFFIPGLASGVGSIFASHAAQASVSKRTRVTIDTLDNLVKAAGLSSVDLIKIDVEGAELLVFQGAAETIRNHRPLLWFEINPQALRTAGLSPADLLEAIKTLGYSSVYELGSVVRGERRPIDDFTKLNNAVAMHEDRLIDFGANKRRT